MKFLKNNFHFPILMFCVICISCSQEDDLTVITSTRSSETVIDPTYQRCITINVEDASVEKVHGQWKIMEGSKTVLSCGFGDQGLEDGNTAMQVLKSLKIDQICYASATNRSFSYTLSDGEAANGVLKTVDENCRYTPFFDLKVQYQQGQYILTDGHVELASFENGRSAYYALRMIEKYKFYYSCRVGDSPGFQYWKGMTTVSE